MKTLPPHRFLLLAAATLLAATQLPAHAQNKGGGGGSTTPVGVITIDQAKAEAGGVTPGDAPGFPVTLSVPGSYRLASHLTLTDPNVSAIEIQADNVTLDLGGLSISTPVTCSGLGSAFNCTVNGQQGYGVLQANKSFATVRNGQIRGFRGGVQLGTYATVEGLTVQHSWGFGIAASHHSTVTGNLVATSGTGIALDSGTVRENTVAYTRTAGVNANATALVLGNRIANIGGFAIATGSGAARDNTMTNYLQGAFYGTVSLGDGQSNLCNGVKC
jgi:hypothetical protein